MADKVYYNPSLGIQSISPSIDDETFLFFLETYYNWMQTTDIIYNASDGPFTQGEIITGQDSRATATVRYVDSSNNMITVSMKTDKSFDVSEEIVGGTSSNSAFVLEMSDNILRKASRLRENKNPQKAQGLFLEYLKQELNKGIPTLTQTDRRKLVSQLRDFFKSKSTEEAYSFLFRALFNETIEIRYPGDDLLRVSDGNFVKQSTIRVGERSAFSIAGTANVISGNAYVFGTNTEFTSISNSDHIRIGTQQAIVANVINNSILVATTNFNTSANNQFLEFLPTFDVFSLKNKTIRGRTSGAVAVVADLRVSFLGGLRYADLVLRLISGEFQENEIVEDIETTSANTIVYGVVSTITINDGGTGYAVDDDIVINGDGAEARAKVSSVSEAPISKILLANTGIGYRNNIEATVNNSGTGGTGLRVRINEIANTYTVGSSNEYTVGDTVSISIINRGSGYKALPTITLQDTAVSALGLLHEKLIRIDDAGTLYEVGDSLVFAGGSGTSVAGQVAAVTERWAETPVTLVAGEVVEPYKDESLLSDFGSLTVITEGDVGILLEQDYEDRLKMEDWRAVGPIERIELTNFGSGYTYPSGLPTVTVTSANGIGASLTVFNIQGRSAVIEIDAANNVAGIGAIREVTILDQGINYTSATVDATGSGDGNANLTADISGIFTNPGYFQNDDGKVNYKVLQDSLFYQDFSYVIRSGLSFDQYKDVVKESIHPAGLEFFGEIVITSTISAVAQFTSEIIADLAADRAPRFVSISSFLSLWQGYGLPPPVTSSIIVKIKPVVAYADNAKLDTHREVNVEINPYINVAAVTSTEYRPIITPTIDVSMFGGANVTVIPVTPGSAEYDIILAGTSVPATFDSSGAVREIDIEPIVINQGATVIESTDPGLKGPLQFALGPVVVSAEFIYSAVAPRTEVSGGVGIIVSTATFTDSEYNVEIPIFVDLAPTIIPSNEVATPKFFKTELDLSPDPTAIYEIDIISRGIVEQTFLPYIFGDYTIQEFATAEISQFANTQFNEGVYRVGESKNEYNIEIFSFTDATMAFYSIITTAETDTRTVEIDVNLLQSVSVVTIEIPREIEISQEPLSVSSLEIKEYNIEISLFNVATVQTTDVITEIDLNLVQNITVNTHARYEIDILSGEGITKGTALFKNIPIDAYSFESIQDYSLVTFNDLSTVTYPNVIARVDSIVEIDLPPGIITQPLNVVPSDFFPDVKYIQPKLNIASTTSAIYEIDLPIISLKGTGTWEQLTFLTDTSDGTGVLNTIGNTSISTYSAISFNDGYYPFGEIENLQTYPSIEIEIAPILIDVSMAFYTSQTKTLTPFVEVASLAPVIIPEVIINVELNNIPLEFKEYVIGVPLYTDLTMAFYTSIVTMESEIRSTEIDINLIQSVASSTTGKYKVDITLGLQRYKDASIEALRGQTLAQYDGEVLNDRIAIARAGFINGRRFINTGNLRLDQFKDDLISSLQNYDFNDQYRDDTIRENVPAQGTTTIFNSSLGELRISRLETELINTFASSAFTDLSGQKVYAVGSNTIYDQEYKVGDYFIVKDEKFIIKAISNSEFLELNVSSAQNHNNVPAYKEYFV